MILKSFYNEQLAQASYLLGCPGSGEAIVIDPNREIDQYIKAAKREGVKITAVTETHIHADYVSGSRELAEITGARLYLSDEGDKDWKYQFANQSNVILVSHGDVIRAGKVRLDVVRTPGHTPEHITFVLTDEAASTEPLGAFTGDFIFVGDVGRPDLLERAAKLEGTMELGAKTLYQSLAQFKESLPDHLVVWPGHGAGSACGKNLGGVPVSSLGYEKLVNWGLRTDSESSFVKEVLAGQPDPPLYFKEMKRINKHGPAILGELSAPEEISPAQVREMLTSPASVVLDTRSTASFSRGSLDGSYHVPDVKNFLTWSGSIIPYDRDIVLIVQDSATALRLRRSLSLIGLDRVVAWYPQDQIDQVAPLVALTQVSNEEFSKVVQEGSAQILDVRNLTEYSSSHVDGAINLPLGRLPERLGELDGARETVVHCAGGTRSVIAISFLRSNGYKSLINLTEGYQGFRQWSEQKCS